MRLYATKIGLQLTDHGANPRRYRDIIWERPIPHCETEEDIFKFMGLDYKTPKERDVWLLLFILFEVYELSIKFHFIDLVCLKSHFIAFNSHEI